MLFSSIVFIFYFLPVVLIGYFALGFSKRLQNVFLFISSLIFYAWGEVDYLVILLSCIVCNYMFGLLIDRYKKKKVIAKYILVSACVVNLGLLFIYKYLNFVVNNINFLFNQNIVISKIVLPLGISFFTFHALSYVIVVYRGTAKVQKNFINLGLYIALFPQLVAGPIVRYTSVEKQIMNRKCTMDKFSVGCCRFITGLSKKIIIANMMANVADRVYSLNSVSSISVSLAWLGSISYTLQIFFDFSAYSDMAIGLGLMFGFEFDENFNYPYISKSISEFWRRWHISLTTWFKDYIYFPLGGSRVENKDIMVRNMFIVWFFTGVWHGANWTFILWGILNFAVMLFERIFNVPNSSRYNAIRHIYTLLLINFGWVLFRADNMHEALKFLGSMFGLGSNSLNGEYTFMFLKEYGVFFILAVVFSTPIAKRCNRLLVDKKLGGAEYILNFSYPLILIMMFIICVTYLVKGSYNPFIYFNF
ncbi:MBOAT family O-acyltransferase [Clostridium oryzae]|uniref:Peptidoglycan O-acetyltransferase n=1 Tax=Clostridium oryzae TaxID=1450648 RepID=A0A1V4I812_9CLOT|nr:MBOAT family protein [Clostridium oryzae]OPJ56111.1 peptidoglycan O-acetyltransferase [Clostridium oryzae]